MHKIITISATYMHKKRGEILKKCFLDKTHFLIEKDGFPLAVLIPVDDYHRVFSKHSHILSNNPDKDSPKDV